MILMGFPPLVGFLSPRGVFCQ